MYDLDVMQLVLEGMRLRRNGRRRPSTEPKCRPAFDGAGAVPSYPVPSRSAPSTDDAEPYTRLGTHPLSLTATCGLERLYIFLVHHG